MKSSSLTIQMKAIEQYYPMCAGCYLDEIFKCSNLTIVNDIEQYGAKIMFVYSVSNVCAFGSDRFNQKFFFSL